MPELPDVTPGEVIASDHINDLRDRAVMRYADTADRDSSAPTPTPGDLAFIEDTEQFQIYSGTNWTSVSARMAVLAPTDDETVPGYGWANVAGLGMFRIGTTAIAFAIASIGRFRITTNGARVQESGSGGYLGLEIASNSLTHDYRFNLLNGELRLQSSPQGTDTWSTLDTWLAP